MQDRVEQLLSRSR